MRLNGEISIANIGGDDDDDDCDGEEEESELGLVRSPTAKATATPTRLVVGYALTSKKSQSFLQPKLLALARYSILPIHSLFLDQMHLIIAYILLLCLIRS